ncbi:hypothetical protein BC829DRAFT_388671 [Chytridium lagenaria]|nr:hypothetical protein BC829DRAFT_388671 [Chytridium lagenaria]
MIMANFQIPSHAFSWMLHAEWIGLSPVDLIFPAFLFCHGNVLQRIGIVYFGNT